MHVLDNTFTIISVHCMHVLDKTFTIISVLEGTVCMCLWNAACDKIQAESVRRVHPI